ncbi:uncharacterized protein LOC116207836 [Punica granatum]|uniref:Uncharacterized protein LOC116207836 n=1 Tax=Punica granatum TaxID=22663 RepID=A0A6P8DKI6_PUNGR|nr:uncharacterized protein LOC116207836 [Punica granatum]
MPQVDLVSVCASGPCDGKFVCETLTSEKDDDPDAPPESFWLSKDAEFDWVDRNAFFERKDSGKGGMTPNLTNLNPMISHSANSQLLPIPLNFKSNASIIGLPKTHKPGFGLDSKNRRNCRAGNTRLFPKLTGSVGKSGADTSMVEPSSPKVSCMGRVRSKKDSDGRRESHDHEPDKARKSRFFSSFQALFHSGCRECRAIAVHTPTAELPARKSPAELMARHVRERTPANGVGDQSWDSIPRRSSVDGEAPGLGGMMRFRISRVEGRVGESEVGPTEGNGTALVVGDWVSTWDPLPFNGAFG